MGVKKAYEWACQKTTAPLAPLWLAVIFLLELVLFLPMDALLALFCLQNPHRRYLYVLAATLASLVTGLIGYFLGLWIWDVIGGFVLQHLMSADFFQRLSAHYTQYESLAVFLGSFLPIPFKAVTLSAGVCHLPLSGYVAALISARALRFLLVAEAMHRFGPQIKAFVDRHFHSLLFAVGAKVVVTLAFFWILGS